MSDKAQGAPLSAHDVYRDVGYPGFVKSLFSRSGDRGKDFTHAILGVATEYSEYLYATDPVNALEEQGDGTFYGQAVVNLVEEFTGKTFDYSRVDEAVSELMVTADEIGPATLIDREVTDLLDVCKRWVGYERAPDDLTAVGVRAVAFLRWVFTTAAWNEKDQKKVELANIAKLLHRYKGMKFDAKNAVNRDVKSERRVLETAAA